MIGSNLFCSQGQAPRWGQQFNWVQLLEFGAFRLEISWLQNRELMTRSRHVASSCQVGFRAPIPDLRNLTVMQNQEVKQLKSHESLHCSLNCEAFEQTFYCACFRVLSIKSRFNCSRQKFASRRTNRRFAVFPQNNVQYFLCFPQEISSEAILSRNCD